MTENDVEFFKLCFNAGLIKEPFLEVGSAMVQTDTKFNLCTIAQNLGVTPALGVDLELTTGVDFAVDFALDPDKFKETWNHGHFQSVAIFNVLEHTFDPISIMTNVVSCTEKGGTIIVLVPTVWPIHSFPKDYVRLLPHWFEELAQKLDLTVNEDYFCFLSEFGINKVSDSKNGIEYNLPNYHNSSRYVNKTRYWKSKVLHKLFNTYGRSHSFFTHTAIGCAYQVN